MPSQTPVKVGRENWWKPTHFAFIDIYKLKSDVLYIYIYKSDNTWGQGSCLAQTGFAAFGKGVQLSSGSPSSLMRPLMGT